jgi:glycine/D-amino acid oxidase-like deaminating enzyme
MERPKLQTDSRFNSLWAATAVAPPPAPALDGDCDCDVAIIGAGFTGLSAALHLAEAGFDVRVLDAEQPGWGASGRNGGMVIPGLKDDPDDLIAHYGEATGEAMIRTSGEAADLVFDLIARHGIECDARRMGWIQPAHTASRLPELERRFGQWSARGIDCEWLDSSRIADFVGHDRYHGGWIDRRAGGLQPLSYARGLAVAAAKAGARVHGASPVTDLRRQGDGWLLSAPGGNIKASQVIMATNGYTPALWPGLKESVVPVLSAQVATEPLSENIRRQVLPDGEILSDTRRILWYFRQDAHGRLIMGGGGTAYESGLDSIYRALRERIRFLLPQATDLKFEYAWYGRVALTADHLPHLHQPAPGLWAGLGYNGRGVAMATMMGKVLADKIAGTKNPTHDFPVMPLRPLPGHALRGLAITATRYYYRFRDALDG